MRNKIYGFLTIVVFVFSSIVYCGDKIQDDSSDKASQKEKTVEKHDIVWNRYDEGLKLAKEQGKKVMVEFTAKWCGWCKRMHATTFKDPRVIELLNKNFIVVSVDGESRDSLNINGWKTTERGLAADFGVRSYPYFFFLTPDGEKIAPVKGYKPADAFFMILSYLSDNAYETMTFQEYIEKAEEGKNKK